MMSVYFGGTTSILDGFRFFIKKLTLDDFKKVGDFWAKKWILIFQKIPRYIQND